MRARSISSRGFKAILFAIMGERERDLRKFWPGSANGRYAGKFLIVGWMWLAAVGLWKIVRWEANLKKLKSAN